MPPMVTIRDEIHTLEEDLRAVRRDARWVREDLKEDPRDPQLRVKLDSLEYRASELGRRISEYEFIDLIDRWLNGVANGRVIPDALLQQLIPQDDDLLAAVHLAREGVKVPKTWRSPTGETVDDYQHDREPLRAA
jgi:hypothetical protein